MATRSVAGASALEALHVDAIARQEESIESVLLRGGAAAEVLRRTDARRAFRAAEVRRAPVSALPTGTRSGRKALPVRVAGARTGA